MIDKKRIAIDIDDTLWNLVPTWLEMFNDVTHCDIKPEDIKSWSIKSYIPEEHREWFWSLLSMETLWNNIHPIYDSQMILKQLNSEYDVQIVTATHWTNMTMKAKRFTKLYPFIDMDKQFNVVPVKQGFITELLADDGSHNLVGGTYNKLLYTQPWNKDFNCIEHGILRVNNQEEMYKGIKMLLPTE